MKSLFSKIDHFLLPKQSNMRFAPYIWLVYLFIFFTNLFFYHPVEHSYFYAAIGTSLFLVAYFNGYWASSDKIIYNIVAILIIGSFMAILSPGASVFFIFAGAFCCRLGKSRKALYGLILIAAWIGLLSWYFDYSSYFYIPAVGFTFMIGGLNIYQHDIDLKRKELNLSQQEVRHLARTSERERIARDLHDLIGHTFSVITLKAELAGKLIDRDNEQAKKEILELETISRDALKQVREVVTGYRTSDLSTELAHAKYILQSNDIDFEYSFEAIELSEKINKELAIILKELVTNILKHAQASRVTVSIQEQKNCVVMKVNDNGVGFIIKENKGFGIKGIKERVDTLQGRLVIDSQNETKTQIEIPLESIYGYKP